MKMIYSMTCEQVVNEYRRNLLKKLPEVLIPFKKIISHAIKVSPNPSQEDCKRYDQMAHEKDLPILTSAIQNQAKYLDTYNSKRFHSNSSLRKQIVQPTILLPQIGAILSGL
jgi:hypothetical protein